MDQFLGGLLSPRELASEVKLAIACRLSKYYANISLFRVTQPQDSPRDFFPSVLPPLYCLLSSPQGNNDEQIEHQESNAISLIHFNYHMSYHHPSISSHLQLPNNTQGNQASQVLHTSMVSHCPIPNKASRLKSTTEFRVIHSSMSSSAARPSINVTEGNDKAIVSVTSLSLQKARRSPLPGQIPRSKPIKPRGSGRRPDPGKPPRLLGTPASAAPNILRANGTNTPT